MIRTRAIINNLSYDDLVKQRIIPDLMPFLSPDVIAIKKYSPFVYANKHPNHFASFGVLMDYIIRAGLRINLQQKVELGVDPTAEVIQSLPDHKVAEAISIMNAYETSKNMNDIARSALELTTLLMGKCDYTHEMMAKYVPTLVNIVKDIIIKWNHFAFYLSGTVKFNAEYSYGCFAGHPDVITDQSILEIKTTGSFPKMAKESCLQVLAYYAIMKPKLPSVKYVGFILPLQRTISVYDVSTWDSARYLQLLSAEGDKLGRNVFTLNLGDGLDLGRIIQQLANIDVNQTLVDMSQQVNLGGISQPGHINNIGAHISKGKNIEKTLLDFTNRYPGLPCQMFLANPRNGKRNGKTAGQIAGAANVIKSTGLLYFTHAPYVINMCANACDDKGEYWQQRILNEDLAYTVAMGGRGVVVHTGARMKHTEEDAMTIMEHMVRSALPYATETCPLLLETPCGEGTEVCRYIQDLGGFFFRFNDEERKKLGVCIDTAHIHGAGYDTLPYFQHWEKHCNVSIKLVHFNDSQVECGACVDRHAAPGEGFIGMDRMVAVAQWCEERRIPMVRE